jgi:glycosyltransferase 2 family protein
VSIKQLVSRLKRQVIPYAKRCVKIYGRWVVLGAILFFLATTLRHHWEEVAAIRVTAVGYRYLAAGLGMTLLAHIWSGWVWGWILQELNQPVKAGWSIAVYLKTNIAKYLPGNIWQFYGRVMSAQQAGFSVSAATLSVVLEPLLMAAAALAIALIGTQQNNRLLQGLILIAVLASVHPRLLNPLLQLASRLQRKPSDQQSEPALQLRRYPLLPLLGEAGFVLLRATGFLLTMSALSPIAPVQISTLVSGFSFAWLLGLIVPGAPGGIGVFEATAIALLHQFPTGIILGSVALYRLVSILAEAIGAAIAWGGSKLKSAND